MAVTLTEPASLNGFTKNNITFMVTSDSYLTAINYRVKYQISVQDGYDTGDFQILAEGQVSLRLGTGFIYPSAILHAAILNRITDEDVLPALSTTVPYKAKISRKYKVSVWEQFNDPLEESAKVNSQEHRAILGGVDDDIYDNGQFFEDLASTPRFFSNFSGMKEIGINQPDFIAYYSNEGESVSCSIKKYDETNSLSDTVTKTIGLSGGEIGVIPVGPKDLGDMTGIVRYKVEIGSISRDYFILQNQDRWYYDLLYLNGFYCPEVFRATGNTQRKINVERYKFRDQEKVSQYDYDFDQIINYRTGYITTEMANALQELLIYNELYEINYDTSKYILLDLVDNNYTISESRRYLQAFSFEARISEKKKIITIL